MNPVDISLSIAAAWLLVALVRRLFFTPKPSRHVWDEFDSASVAHALRKENNGGTSKR